jgi:hypothetical protein
MRGGIVLLVCLLLAGVVRAGERELLNGSLDAEVEAAASQRFAPGPGNNLHAIFYKEDPDRFAAAAGVWWARLEGPVSFSDGAELDVSDTLGLRAVQAVPYARLAWRIGWLELELEGFWYDNAGNATVQEEFEIDGVIFEVGDIIDSDVKIYSYQLAIGFRVLHADWMTLNLQLGVGALYTEGSVTAVSAGKSAKWDTWLPLPLIGFAANGYLIKYPWTYEVQFGWIGFSTKALGANALDVRLALGYEINDWVNFKVGYRFLGIRADVDELTAKIDLSGFYLELGFFF